MKGYTGLIAVFLIAALVAYCGTRLSDLHLSTRGVDFHLVERSDQLNVHLTLPITEESLPIYRDVAKRMRVIVSARDTVHRYRLIADDALIHLDTVSRRIWIDYRYEPIN